jgi:DeoR/GlpR family transcriptional regulator of sugar metabolism
MYPAERRQQILKLLGKDERVSVAELATRFGVSLSSIRRDLNYLHGSGWVQRTYGGALGQVRSSYETPFSERSVSHREEKNRIGKAAAQLIEPGETVCIDGGTTTECMIAYLAEKSPLTVATFGLNIATRLVCCEDIIAIILGGILHRPSLTLGGVLTLDDAQSYNLRFDKAFIAASGVSAEGGITNASLEEIPMKRRTMAAAKQTILLADSSKIGVIATGLIVPAHKIARLVTDSRAPMDEIEKLRALGVIVDLV